MMAQRGEIYGRRRDGSEFPAEASISKFRGPDGLVFTVILRDITDRRAAEQMLRGAHDELEKRVRERTAELEERNAPAPARDPRTSACGEATGRTGP
jgi:hypothetical protein